MVARTTADGIRQSITSSLTVTAVVVLSVLMGSPLTSGERVGFLVVERRHSQTARTFRVPVTEAAATPQTSTPTVLSCQLGEKIGGGGAGIRRTVEFYR
jgi:hypothetical protein